MPTGADLPNEVGLTLTSRVLVAVTLASALLAGAAVAGIGPNPADDRRLIDKPIENYRYDRATHCEQGTPPGTKALIDWLGRHTDGAFWGSYRCEKFSKGNYSLHSESRAIDWAMDARDHSLKTQAMKLIRERLLATDRRGNDNALARRMGVQGIIYDCHAWFSGSGGLERYSYCFNDNGKRIKDVDPTAAHIDHIHIELNELGARKKTSFWRSELR